MCFATLGILEMVYTTVWKRFSIWLFHSGHCMVTLYCRVRERASQLVCAVI